jgi:nitroreductase
MPITFSVSSSSPSTSVPDDSARWAAALMQSRQTVLPKRLLAPGPDAAQLQALLGAAASAPDHGQLLPWRLVLVPAVARAHLAQAFADALLQRDALALPEQVAQAKEKAFRAPLLMLLVVSVAQGDSGIDVNERLISAGCAVQNMLLMATAQGFGSALTSGKALKSTALRTLFALAADDMAICFISVGTVSAARPGRTRPVPADYVSTLQLVP